MAPMQPNGWTMDRNARETPGSRGKHGAHSQSGSTWAKPNTLDITAAIHAEERAKGKEEEVSLYLRPTPPPGLGGLFEAHHIIAGKHLVPLGLDRYEALDGVRIKNKTWISYDGEYSIHLSSDHPLHLKQACKDIYTLIRDLRLTSERPAQRFIVQRPSPWLNNGDAVCITLITGSRPCVSPTSGVKKTCLEPVAEDLIPKTVPHIMPLAMSLTGLGKDLLMRISFGRVNLQKKKKKFGNETNYDQLPHIMKSYVTHGGAVLGSKLPVYEEGRSFQLPEVHAALERLGNSATGIRRSRGEGYQLEHTLVLTLQNDSTTSESDAEKLREIWVDMSNSSMGKAQMRIMESWARLDWTVLAPDREYDWNLKVNARETHKSVPDEFMPLLKNATTKQMPTQGLKSLKIREVQWNVSEALARHLDEQIKDVQMRTSALIPVEGEPYVVEISVTQTRPGLAMTKPEITWDIGMHGSQWEEALNNVSSDGLRKDWGRGLVNVWPNGNGDRNLDNSLRGQDGLESLETRFGHFLRCVLKVQAALEGLEIEELSEALV